MRPASIAALALLLTACAVQPSGPPPVVSTLAPADAATTLIAGPLTLRETTTPPAVEGADPVVTLELVHADGRVMRLQQGNHTNNDLMAQSPGGALAQVMGLMGEEAPTLYHAVDQQGGAPFMCAPEGPRLLGLYADESGAVTMVGLKQAFEFETRPDGVEEALPYSPDQVCARMRFTRG